MIKDATRAANIRGIEGAIHTDARQEMSYASHLGLETLLDFQRPVSEPVHHDELLFIIQHQTSKLVLHELRSAMEVLAADELRVLLKRIAGVKHIQKTLTEQWSVPATLTSSEYAEFCGTPPVLGMVGIADTVALGAITDLLG